MEPIHDEVDGSTTWRRRDLEQGLEPDECYWVQNEARAGRVDLDLREDPPPDLVIEVDIHGSSVDRMVIYGALGVPEIWCYKDDNITVHVRQEDGSYRVADASACFPRLPMPELAGRLVASASRDETTFIRGFRKWVAGLRPQ